VAQPLLAVRFSPSQLTHGVRWTTSNPRASAVGAAEVSPVRKGGVCRNGDGERRRHAFCAPMIFIGVRHTA